MTVKTPDGRIHLMVVSYKEPGHGGNWGEWHIDSVFLDGQKAREHVEVLKQRDPSCAYNITSLVTQDKVEGFS